MFDYVSGLWPHLVSVAVMATIILSVHRWTHQRHDRRALVDAERFQAALGAELVALREVYEDNLRLISDRAGYVLSARALLGVYRGNLGRLIILPADQIARLVATNAAQERLEALLAVLCKSSANLAWRTPDDDTQLAEIRQATLRAFDAAGQALALLDAEQAGDVERATAERPDAASQLRPIPNAIPAAA